MLQHVAADDKCTEQKKCVAKRRSVTAVGENRVTSQTQKTPFKITLTQNKRGELTPKADTPTG